MTFELVYSTIIKGLWPDMGIRSEDQAVQVILSQINNVENCLTGLDFETFSEIGNTHMPATVERAVDVIAAVMRSAPSSLADKLDINDLERLQVLAKRIARFAEPVPLDDLWGARVRILPNIEMALAGRNTYAAYTHPRRSRNVSS